MIVRNSSIINEEKKKIDEIKTIAPVYQDKVFIIMWQSSKSGGTYTETRKSEQGKTRLLETLGFYGIDLSSVRVIEQPKPWVPTPKAKRPTIGGKRGKKRGIQNLLQ